MRFPPWCPRLGGVKDAVSVGRVDMLTHVAWTFSVVLYLVMQTVVLYAAANMWVTGGGLFR